MRENWPFRIGLVLFVAQAFVFPTGSPYALGFVSIACISCLLVGLFRYAISNVQIVLLIFYTVGTALLVLIPGRALFAVVESLTYDTSADVHVEHVILTTWSATFAALMYGIVHRIRRRRIA